MYVQEQCTDLSFAVAEATLKAINLLERLHPEVYLLFFNTHNKLVGIHSEGMSARRREDERVRDAIETHEGEGVVVVRVHQYRAHHCLHLFLLATGRYRWRPQGTF